jgi:hypothetical protein
MSSDEDEELAQLRAQRAARLGPAGATLVSTLPWHGFCMCMHPLTASKSLLVQSQLRARQQQAVEADVEAAAYYDRCAAAAAAASALSCGSHLSQALPNVQFTFLTFQQLELSVAAVLITGPCLCLLQTRAGPR